jgi:hypothetical protein
MRWTRASLSELSGGSGWRAGGIIVLAHLAPAPVMLAIWVVGLHSIFDDARWIPAWIALIAGSVMVVGLIGRFGMWGTPASGNRDHGEDYMDTFGTRLGFGLGWLRWFMQIVLVAVVLVPGLMTWTDVRAWHLLGTDELRALPERAAAIPVPDDWVLVETESTGFGLAEFVDWPDGREPHGSVEQRFEVPSDFTFDDLKGWVASPDWAEDPEGDPFGAVELESCDTDTMRCDARLVPPPGEQPEHFVRATLHEPATELGEPEVEVLLTYRKYVDPDWDVSRETIDRALSIPVPSDWVRHSDAIAETTRNGERISQVFGVPESTTRDDVETWLSGSQWTDPSAGAPFGAVELERCREVGPGELDRSYLCSVRVVRREGASGPIESLRVSLDADHTVRVSLERNG